MIIIHIVAAYIPIAIFLYCYGFLIKGLYFTKTICRTDTDEDRSLEKKKLVVTFILATVGFVIGYGPTVVLVAAMIFEGNEPINFKDSDLSIVFYFMFYCSLCLNPILYAFRSAKFQEGLKRIIFRRKPPTQNDIQLA